MTKSEFHSAYLRDPRLAAHALNPAPVWLWSADGKNILWANPIGASIFDATSPAAVAALRFGPRHAAAAQISRLATTLPQGGAPRLERLRGFGAGIGSMLICLCSRITLADNSAAVFIVSTERAGRDLALPERARRLLEDVRQPAAIFTADGELIEAQPAADALIGDKRDLVALGAQKLAREASLNGVAEGKISSGTICMVKLGAGPTFGLLVVFTKPSTKSAAAPRPRPRLTRRRQTYPNLQNWNTVCHSGSSGRLMLTPASLLQARNLLISSERKPLPCSAAIGSRSLKA